MYYLSAWDHYLNSPWHVSNTVHFSHSVNVNNTNSRPYWPQQDASEESKDFAFGMANLFRQTGALLSITTACIWLWSDTGKYWNMVICRFWESLFVYSIMLKPVLTWVSQTLFSLSVCQSVTHHNMLFRFPDESSELDIIQSESEYSIFQTVCVGFCQFMQTWFSQVQKPLFFSLWAVRRWLCAMGEPLLKKHRTTVEPNETEPDPEPALLTWFGQRHLKHSANWQRTKCSQHWRPANSTSLWDFKKLANPVQEAHTRWIEQSDSARPRILEGRCSTWSKLLLLDLWFPIGKTSRWFVALWLFKLDIYSQHDCWKASIQWDDKLHWVWQTALAKPTVLAMVCY